MDNEITFGDIENEKHKFHCYKNPIFLKDADTDKALAFNKISSSEKTISTLLVTCMMIMKLNH